MSPISTTKTIDLDPSDILIRDNVRFNWKNYRVDSLAESILSHGGVHTPITVEKLTTPVDGRDYALVFGGYRTAAVEKLNRESNAGLKLPARVIPEMKDADRLILQVSENNDRENMSPMDQAIAMQKMISAGLSKIDVRKAFAAPGGRKGMKVQMMSNSHVNIRLSFLSFPKAVQNKIHDGTLPIGAAMKLAKMPQDKWAAVLEQAEKDRIKDIETEERDEKNYLTQSKKADEAEQEAQAAAADLAKIKADADAAAKAHDDAVNAVGELHKAKLAAQAAKDKAAREAADKAYKEADAKMKETRKAKDEAERELSKITDKETSLQDKAKAARERLEAARKAKADKAAAAKSKAPKDEKITGTAIDKAAAKVGGVAKKGKLNATEMREAINSVVLLAGSKKPKTLAIANFILQCFDSVISDGDLERRIAEQVGEEKPAATKVAPKK